MPNINSSECLVSVTARDVNGNTGSDISNSTFTILPTDNSTNETIPGGTATVEGPPESNTTVNVTADGDVIVTVAYYDETPHPEADEPYGGHTTGDGWFYPDGESTLSPEGKANFGFTAKYKGGSSTGKLNFQYKDADIHLKSTSIDWLTISAVSAQFQGTGTINGEGLYTFRVQAKDNGVPGAGNDYFDIKIWNGTDTEDDPIYKANNTIADGDIKVHT